MSARVHGLSVTFDSEDTPQPEDVRGFPSGTLFTFSPGSDVLYTRTTGGYVVLRHIDSRHVGTERCLASSVPCLGYRCRLTDSDRGWELVRAVPKSVRFRDLPLGAYFSGAGHELRVGHVYVKVRQSDGMHDMAPTALDLLGLRCSIPADAICYPLEGELTLRLARTDG